MTGPSGERCRNCYFWEEWGIDEPKAKELDKILEIDTSEGWCNRFPVLVKLEDGCLYKPHFKGHDWCGEFKQRENDA